ncbi:MULTISPECIES: DUF2793 domain-containing protein [Pacificimonas]|nr:MULTISPECIES: DUF2793 domain-containing protein [Pacificimonas]
MTGLLSLPLLQSAQAQKEVTHNEAITGLERWTFPRVQSRSLTAPPADPPEGDAWIVAAEAGGDWAGQDGTAAEWRRGAWTFLNLPVGSLLWVADEGLYVHRSPDGSWTGNLPVQSVEVGEAEMLGAERRNIAVPTGGATVDLEARQTLSDLVAALTDMGLINP